jgi:hypothetical protein
VDLHGLIFLDVNTLILGLFLIMSECAERIDENLCLLCGVALVYKDHYYFPQMIFSCLQRCLFFTVNTLCVDEDLHS